MDLVPAIGEKEQRVVAPAGPLPTDFVVLLAQALHRQGMACHHLESLLGRVAERLGLRSHMLALPTAFLASLDDGRASAGARSVIVRIDPGSLDLSRQSKLIMVGRQVAAGTLSIDAAAERVGEIEREPGLAWWLQLPAGAVVAGAAGRLFGGGFGEMLLAALIGLFVAILTRAIRATRTQRLHDPLAASVAALIASAGSAWIVEASPAIVVLGGLMLLLPGYAFTVALDELAARHLVAGTARSMGALTVILFLGLSVLLAGKLTLALPAAPLFVALPVVPPWVDVVAIGLGLLGLGVWFRTPWRELPWVLVLGGAAEAIERLSVGTLEVPLAASLAALFLALSCNSVARVAGRVANAVLAPALMLLLPGSLGLRSMFALSANNVISGVETAYQMLLVAVAIVTGLLLGNLLLPSRRQ
ncbi:MAG: threonine/serine exporter family protein [Proteobacteria bacterium]|nr:threonine/serine exporter family protein [Pseudomonadota bacterium]